MNSVQSPSYPLGGTATERDRLLRQARDYEPQAAGLLDQVGIKKGGRVADIGCGPIGILNLLSQRVGAEGSVVGVERESRFVEMARDEIRERGLANVSIVQADALDTGLDKGAFDLVHERLVMVNVTAREAFLAEMLSLLRPGGTIILADIDNVSWVCDPPHASWGILLDAFHSAFHAGGGDGFIGRRLPGLLRKAGVEDVKVQTTVVTPDVGDYRRTHLISLINSVKDKIIALGILTEGALIEHRDALLAHLNSPDTTVVDKLFVQAWGRKKN
jgi:SAM-dependent methyltransferase